MHLSSLFNHLQNNCLKRHLLLVHTTSLIYIKSESVDLSTCQLVRLLTCQPVDMSTSTPSVNPHNISNLPSEHFNLSTCQPVDLSTLHHLIQADPEFRFADIRSCWLFCSLHYILNYSLRFYWPIWTKVCYISHVIYVQRIHIRKFKYKKRNYLVLYLTWHSFGGSTVARF